MAYKALAIVCAGILVIPILHDMSLGMSIGKFAIGAGFLMLIGITIYEEVR